MTKKMFRKLLMISAVLLLLVSVQANADCVENCQTQCSNCTNQAASEYYYCMFNIGNPAYCADWFYYQVNMCYSSYTACLAYCN